MLLKVLSKKTITAQITKRNQLFSLSDTGCLSGNVLMDAEMAWSSFFFFKDFIIFFPFSPQSPPVHGCIFFVVGPSSCGMWDAASAWFDEQCHVHAQDWNQRNTGPPAAERANLTIRPWGQPLTVVLMLTFRQSQGTFHTPTTPTQHKRQEIPSKSFGKTHLNHQAVLSLLFYIPGHLLSCLAQPCS